MRTRGDKRRSVEALAWDAWCVYREVKHEKYVARRKHLEKIVKVRCVGGGEAVCEGQTLANRSSASTPLCVTRVGMQAGRRVVGQVVGC